jgi:hypothetical protein
MKISTMAVWGILGSMALGLSTARAEAIVVRGEMARFARLVYDHQYRNSNGNVFRNSKHANPTRNPFRSSRYYRQRLAASTDGYPVQTWVRYDERIGDVYIPREERYVYHSRSPRGPVGFGDVGGVPEAGLELLEIEDLDEGLGYEPEPARRPGVIRTYGRPRPKRPTPPPAPPRPASQRPVLEQVTGPDGKVRTVIRSVPIEEG